jgi:hypothetical protein
VLPFFILAQSVGALVTHLLSLINEAVLRKEDITSPDAGIMADMFEHLAQKCKQIMTVSDPGSLPSYPFIFFCCAD